VMGGGGVRQARMTLKGGGEAVSRFLCRDQEERKVEYSLGWGDSKWL